MGIADLDAVTISKFLEYLQTDRGNTTSTRNTRLAAIHSFFGYAALHAPEHAGLIQRVLAIPPKRVDRAIVSFLTKQESDALIDAPDLSTWIGRRDHTLLTVAVQTGLRVSELTGLNSTTCNSTQAHMCDASAKAAKSAAPHSPAPPSPACATGLANAAGMIKTRYSQHVVAGRAAATRCNISSTNTLRPRPSTVHRCRPRTSPLIPFGTPAPWHYSTPAWTSRSSLSGSATFLESQGYRVVSRGGVVCGFLSHPLGTVRHMRNCERHRGTSCGRFVSR